MSRDRIDVDFERLGRSLAGLTRREQAFLDLDKPLRPGEYRGLDSVGALGPVHDEEAAARFDQRVRRLLATLEALVEEHMALLRPTLEGASNCLWRYQENERTLAEIIRRLGYGEG